MAESKSRLLRVLDVIERIGNKLPDPFTLFVLFALAVIVASAIAAGAGVSAVHPGTRDTINVVNLLTVEQIRRIFMQAVQNFVTFAPLGLVLVVIIGIGVTERSGLIAVALRRLVTAVPKSMITAALVFGGIMSSMAADAGYIVLTPLGALLFAGLKRHPLAGLAAAFAGVSAGFSANLLITSIDPLLAGLSTEAARLLDPAYEVLPTANYYFMIASVFLLTALGTWVTHQFVEPRLGTWDPSRASEPIGDTDLSQISPLERKGLRAAGLAFVGYLLLVGLFTFPDLVGLPRDWAIFRLPVGEYETTLQSLAPLLASGSIVTNLMLLFLVMGIAYGVVAGTIRNDRDVARMSGEGMATMGSYIVLAFAAAQFVAYFNWSNLGIIMAIQGADGLRAVGFTGLPLLLSFVLVSAILNMFIGSASAKWAVMAPVFIPMLMQLGYSPEAVQAAYRVGDSTTNIITPLLPYFPIIIAFARKYDRGTGLGTLISAMLPYTIVFAIGWLILLTIWILLGIPLGPGAPLNYVPAS
jgi:aminobenzoyl-glutamate transport protein